MELELSDPVVEGSNVSVCVEFQSDLDCPVKFPIQFYLDTVNDTASKTTTSIPFLKSA